MFSTAHLRSTAAAVTGDLKPELLTGAQAAAALDDVVAVEKMCAAARRFLVERVAQTDAWRGQGFQSPADWHASKAGIGVGTSASQLAAAKKAKQLPATSAAMRNGDLSPEQATSVADAATADPASEGKLLKTAAKNTTAELKQEAAKVKAAATDSATRDKRIRAQRFMRSWTDSDGAWNLRLRGPGADGIDFEALFRRYRERRFRMVSKTGERDTFENREYDAFKDLLTDAVRPPQPSTSRSPGDEPSAARSEPPASPSPTSSSTSYEPSSPTRYPASAGEPTTPPSPSPTSPEAPPAGPSAANGSPPESAESPEPFADHDTPTGKLSGGDNIKVIVRIDWTALARGHTIAGETCDVVGVGPISVGTAKYLMQDAFLSAVITKGVDVVNVAHLGRGLNAHQRTAVELMGIRCSNEKCNRTIAIQIDHRVDWVKNEETKLDNQDPLCPDCHRKKTHHHAYLVPGTGRRAFIEPEAGEPGGGAPGEPEPEAGEPEPSTPLADPPLADPPPTVDQPTLL